VLAAAGEADALGVGRGLALVTFVLGGLLVFAAVSARTSLVMRTPLDDPPAVLVDRAERIVEAAGYAAEAGDTAWGFMPFADYRQWLRGRPLGPQRWDGLASGNPSAVLFWYRSAPRDLLPVEEATVSLLDPPAAETDMREVVLDPAGRLQRFRSVPPQFDDSSGAAPAPPWTALLEAAGLSMPAFVEAAPRWSPPDFADARAAWTGPHPALDEVTLRVEAASYRGRPVYFEVIGPWTEPARMEPDTSSAIDNVLVGIMLGVFAGLIGVAAVLARRHLRTGRADRRGASRIMVYMVAAGIGAWVLRASHASSTAGEIDLFFRETSVLILLAVIFWAVYLALEPYVRRLWPDALLGWSRLLAGHVRDPRVGRDVLMGLGCGVAVAWIAAGKATIIPALGFPAPYPRYGFGDLMLGDGGAAIWVSLLESVNAIGGALFTVLGIVVLRLVLRWRWLAFAVTALFLSIVGTYDMNPGFPWSLAFPLATGVLLTVTAVRWGLLVLVVALFTWGVLEAVPMTLDVSHWSATASNWTVALLGGLALAGFYAARAGQPLFGSVLKE